MVYQFISDDTAQYARYRANEIDVTDNVPSADLADIRAHHAKELVIAPYLATAYYGFNLSSRPLKNNKKLRQALSMAIDRDQLVASFGFGQPPAYAFIPPGVLNYSQQSLAWKNLSAKDRLSVAQQLYRDAGYAAGTEPLKIRLLYNSNIAIKRTAIMIAAMWKENLGVETELVEQEYKAFLTSRHDRTQWDVARLAWVADFNDASNFLDTFRSDSANNDEGYANAEFDAALMSAAQAPDATSRRQNLESAERILMEDYAVAPLYYFVSKRLVKSSIMGAQPTPLDRLPSKSLSRRP